MDPIITWKTITSNIDSSRAKKREDSSRMKEPIFQWDHPGSSRGGGTADCRACVQAIQKMMTRLDQKMITTLLRVWALVIDKPHSHRALWMPAGFWLAFIGLNFINFSIDELNVVSKVDLKM